MVYSSMYGFLALATAILSSTVAVVSASPSTASIPVYAPLPIVAIGLTIPSTPGYVVHSFGGGAYMVTEGIYQAMFLVSTNSVIVIDAPPTIGKNLVYAIKNTTALPISHVVYSHAHADHIGAAYLYGPHVAKKNRPAPTVTFEKTLKLRVHNQTLELAYLGPNHEPGNIFIYAPVQKVLMIVDIIFTGWVPFSHLGDAGNVVGFIKAHDQILSYDFDYLVGGHLGRPGTREDVLTQQEYIQDLSANCAEAVTLSGLPPNATNPISAYTMLPAIAAVDPHNFWATFKIYLDNLSTYCANITNEKWVGRFGGADVYGFENAYVILQSQRIDFDRLGPFGVS